MTGRAEYGTACIICFVLVFGSIALGFGQVYYSKDPKENPVISKDTAVSSIIVGYILIGFGCISCIISCVCYQYKSHKDKKQPTSQTKCLYDFVQAA